MNKEIREIQKSLIYSIFHHEFDFLNYQEIKSFLPKKVFGEFQKFLDFLDGKSFSELQIEKLSTEIVKYKLSEIWIEIITTNYPITNFFEDIKILVKLLFEKNAGFDELIKIQEIIQKLEEKKHQSNSKKYLIRNLYEWVLEEIWRRSERKNKWLSLGYSTGFPLLDKYTEGLQKWTVTRLNAYSNVGKSKFSYQIVNSVLDQWAKVIYFSLEVTTNQLVCNLISNKYKLPISEVNKMNFGDIDFWELFTKKLEIVDDKYYIDEIIAYTEARKPDVIFIDFIQNIQVEWWSEYERMTKLAIFLQQLAIRNNIAIFDISQISNDGQKNTHSDIIPSKGSGALVASADVGLLMRRDNTDEKKIIVKIAKNKFWWRKTLEFSVNYESWTFTEIGEPILHNTF